MRRTGASALAVLIALIAATAARADVVDDNPAASSRAPGQVTVFIRGPGGDLQYAELSNGTFTPWYSQGGLLTSGPGALGRTADITDTFVRGGDNGLWYKAWVAGTGWQDYTSLGGGVLSAPGVAYRANGGYSTSTTGARTTASWRGPTSPARVGARRTPPRWRPARRCRRPRCSRARPTCSR